MYDATRGETVSQVGTQGREQAPALAAVVARIRRYRARGGVLRTLAREAQVSERLLHKWLRQETHDAYSETLDQVDKVLAAHAAAATAADGKEQRGHG